MSDICYYLSCRIFSRRLRSRASQTAYYLRQREATLYDTPRTNDQILTMLAATPSRLDHLSEGLSPTQLITSPEPGEWSVRDVLAHLRACADMWGKYIVQILTENKPTIRAVNPTTWIKKTDYREREFQPS